MPELNAIVTQRIDFAPGLGLDGRALIISALGIGDLGRVGGLRGRRG